MKLLAPNGQPSNLTPEQYRLVRTPAFKEWFGDWENDSDNASKVVDGNGEPLVVYHGTKHLDFNTFDREENVMRTTDWKLGMDIYYHPSFFSENMNYANMFRSRSGFPNKTDNSSGRIIAVFLNIRNPNTSLKEISSHYIHIAIQKNVILDNSQDGFKGLEQGYNEIVWVALYPTQIKLADGSNTTFDGSNPDIRYADGGGVEYSEDDKLKASKREYNLDKENNKQRDSIKVLWDYLEGIIKKYERSKTDNELEGIKYNLSPDDENSKIVVQVPKGEGIISGEITIYKNNKLVSEFLNDEDYPQEYYEYYMWFTDKNGKKYRWRHRTKAVSRFIKKLKAKYTGKFSDGGTLTTLLAPNGKPSNLTPEQYKLVRTPAFKKWFGDWENSPETASKVVDENGEPKVVFHGSERSDSILMSGIFEAYGSELNELYFTDNINTALSYTYDELWDEEEEEGIDTEENIDNVIAVFLNIKNPKIKDLKGRTFTDFWNIKKDNDGNILINVYDVRGINEKLKRKDYLGNTYVVYESTQIKLADGTNTTFDGSNPDIRYKNGGLTMKAKLLAPNGKPSNLTPEQYRLVRTPAFKAWFGDWENSPETASKVVDENGEPLVVYHFTDKKFNIFELKGLSNGFFFTKNKKDKEFSYYKNPKSYFLNIKKMSEVSNFSAFKWSIPYYENQWIEEAKKKVVSKRWDTSEFKGISKSDGIKFIRSGDEKTIIVAFYPNQIKLADGSNTTFDSNPDIRYANGGEIEYVRNYIKDIQVVEDESDGGWMHYGEFGNNGGLSWNTKGEFIVVNTIDSGNKKGGEGTMAIANLFLLNPKAKTIIYQDHSHFNDGTSFWQRIGGDYTDLDRIDFFNYFNKKFGYNPDIRYANGGLTMRKQKKQRVDFDNTSVVIKLVGYGNEEEFKDLWSENIIPKNPFFAWLYNDVNANEKISSGQYDLAKFKNSLGLFWDIDAKDYKGGENIISLLKGRISDDGKKIYILSMTTNPIYRRSGSMSFLIRKVREKFNIEKDNLHFVGLTDMGEKFYSKKKFDLGGTTMRKPKLLAPNGQPSNLTPDNPAHKVSLKEEDFGFFSDGIYYAIKLADGGSITSNENFKQWFGNSKVVNKRGKPLIVHHGTPYLNRFKKDYVFKTRGEENKDMLMPDAQKRVEYERAYFFTDSISIAKSYIKKPTFETEGRGIISVYLSLQNPLIVDADGEIWRNFEITISDKKLIGTTQIKKYAKDNGYDGMIVYNVKDYYDENEKRSKGSNVYVAFSPTQIKLADGSNTTFDSYNPDIRYADGGEIEEVKNYLKNIRVDKKYMESESDLSIVQYQSDFGRKGTLVWRAYPEWGKDGLGEDVKGSIYISSISRGTEGDSYSFVSSIEGKKDSRGEGAMALASLFLRYPLVHSVHYEDESGFEDELGYYKISFWQKIGGDESELMREDFFNYFTKKFGYNPDSNTQNLLERYKLLEELIAEEIKEKSTRNENRYSKQNAKQIQAHYHNLKELVALKEKRKKYIESINPDAKFSNGGTTMRNPTSIPDLLSSQEVSDKLGRELHWWNDDIVYLSGGIKYKKVFLKNEYKKIN